MSVMRSLIIEMNVLPWLSTQEGLERMIEVLRDEGVFIMKRSSSKTLSE